MLTPSLMSYTRPLSLTLSSLASPLWPPPILELTFAGGDRGETFDRAVDCDRVVDCYQDFMAQEGLQGLDSTQFF